MRAVNLIPSDQRRGGGGGTSVATNVLLGGLAAIVVAVGAYVLADNSVNSRRGELARVTADATSTEQRAAALKPYSDFASMRQTRAATVASLASSRFDWHRVMNEMSRALPGNVWLTSLIGTVAPGVTIDGASSAGDTGSLRSAVPSPAVELVGCTESQAEVSRVMARLRLLHGVTRIALAASEKTDSSSGGGPSGASSGGSTDSSDCRNGLTRLPKFQLVVFFKAPAGAVTPGGHAPGQAATQPTSTGASK
ncbi:MAG: PilN domain-containing protein [Actinomycetota bacterium]|nr:PilN domain-containing protein [Actinomycetota bacterium]